MNESENFMYLENKEHFLELSYSALVAHFKDKHDFVRFFKSIENDNDKNEFLRISSFYKYLVSDGNFRLNDNLLDDGMDYINESYKFMAIFSLIESIYGKESFIDFYQFLARGKTELKYPIRDKKTLENLYKQYKNEFGATKNAIRFFDNLDSDVKKLIKNKLQTENNDISIVELASILYTMRSEFVHRAKFVTTFGKRITVSRHKNRIVVNDLTLSDLKYIFEKGLLSHYGKTSFHREFTRPQ